MIDQKIANLIKEALIKVEKITNQAELEALELLYFARKNGRLNDLFKYLKSLPQEEKKHLGAIINEAKITLVALFENKKNEIISSNFSDLAQREGIDVTIDKNYTLPGSLHPITKIRYQIEDFFTSMGFIIIDGPEMESDFYNFEALNIPSNHPARDMQDTFYIKNQRDLVMRTQTSSVQVRAMRKYGAPLKVIVPGRVFRREETDASHEHTFYQIEGLMIGKEITIANLIAVMKTLLARIFGQEIKVRLRPGFFPFVEPGFELDISCLLCGGKGCGACKQSGWLELLPCGMVHPNVLQHGHIDAVKYNGFAFGLGLDRLVMMKYNINDIRLFHSGNLKFLYQFYNCG